MERTRNMKKYYEKMHKEGKERAGKEDTLDKDDERDSKGESVPPINGTDFDKPTFDVPIPERSTERGKGKRAHRTPEGREIDRTRMIQMMSRGYTVSEIAEKLNVSNQCVYSDYKAVLKEMRQQRKELTEEIIECKLLEYREIKKEAWDAWERSKSSHITTKTKEVTSGGLAGKTNFENSQVTETRVGDNSYLAVVLECIKAERDLQGLDPEKKMRLTGEMINWDILASGVPISGPVPDLIEQEIRKGMEADSKIMSGLEDNTIYISRASSDGSLVPNNETRSLSKDIDSIPSVSNEPTLEELENDTNINLATEPIEKEK